MQNKKNELTTTDEDSGEVAVFEAKAREAYNVTARQLAEWNPTGAVEGGRGKRAAGHRRAIRLRDK